jgi:cation-transporting ATPase 13A1
VVTEAFKCIMITGDNPLTAVHVARDVEIVDREVLILDLKEYPRNEAGQSIQLLTLIFC